MTDTRRLHGRIITDAGIDDATREGLQRLGIEVIIAETPP